MAKAKKISDRVATERRSNERRNRPDRRVESAPVAVERRNLPRRAKVARRRQIDPTTCERDYTTAEVEFMSALEQYKRASGRMFPTCSEVLEVLLKLGYEKKDSLDIASPSPPAEPAFDAGPATQEA